MLTPAGPGPAVLVANAVRLTTSGGTVHLGRLLASEGVRYVVLVQGLAPSTVGSLTSSVNAPPPPGLEADLLGAGRPARRARETSACTVFQNDEAMPVTAQRAAPLPVGPRRGPIRARPTWWDGNPCCLRCRASSAHGPVKAGTVYAGYAPAGKFSLTVDGRSVHAAPGVRMGGAVRHHQGGRRALVVPVPLCAARRHGRGRGMGRLVGCPSGTPAPAAPGAPERVVSPAHASRAAAHSGPERRWPVLLVVAAVIVGTAVGLSAQGSPSPAPAPADARRTGQRARRRSPRRGTAPARRRRRAPPPASWCSPTRPTRAVTAEVTTVTDTGATVSAAVPVPAQSVLAPSLPVPSSGSWQAETVTLDGGGVVRVAGGARPGGVVRGSVPELDVGQLVLRFAGRPPAPTPSMSHSSIRRRRPSWWTSAS